MGTLARKYCDGCSCEEPANVVLAAPLKELLPADDKARKNDLCVPCLKQALLQIVENRVLDLESEIISIKDKTDSFKEEADKLTAAKILSEEETLAAINRLETLVWG